LAPPVEIDVEAGLDRGFDQVDALDFSQIGPPMKIIKVLQASKANDQS
jgi:hypothetical protein